MIGSSIGIMCCMNAMILVASAPVAVVTNVTSHYSANGEFMCRTNDSTSVKDFDELKKRSERSSRDMKDGFAKSEEALALRRKNDSQGRKEPALNWKKECLNWCKSLGVKQRGANVFVDGNGCRHIVGVGVVETEGKTALEKRVAKGRCHSEAMRYCLMAGKAEVESKSTVGEKGTGVGRQTISSKTIVMEGHVKSYQTLYVGQTKDEEGVEYDICVCVTEE